MLASRGIEKLIQLQGTVGGIIPIDKEGLTLVSRSGLKGGDKQQGNTSVAGRRARSMINLDVGGSGCGS